MDFKFKAHSHLRGVLIETWVTKYSGDIGYTQRYIWRKEMPWQECTKVDEKLKYVARLLDGEQMSSLC